MAQYRSHTDATLGYMADYLKEYHQFKWRPFKKYRATKKTKQEIAQSVHDLQEDQRSLAPSRKEQVVEGREAKRRHVQNNEQSLRLQGEELARHFNFVKMHLPTHYEEHVRCFGSITAFSTEVGESAHCRQVKDGYQASNHQPSTFYRQIISYYTRVLAMGIRQLNVKQLAKEGHYTGSVADVVDLLNASGKWPRSDEAPLHVNKSLKAK